MIYLKTYMYAQHELEFIIANLQECYDHIDKMIVCEFNINHTGEKRNFEFEDLCSKVPENLRDKLDYHACDIYDITARAFNDEDTIHRVNEPIMRSFFTTLYDFDPEDIIISVDADEILYREEIQGVIDKVKTNNIVSLKMRQFFYKKTYLWEDIIWRSAIACKFKAINPAYPNNWRDTGVPTEDFVGCHFSWCMSTEAMIKKLYTYSHPCYRFCADKEILQDAIDNKKYPFDKNRSFNIKEIDSNSSIIPTSLRG